MNTTPKPNATKNRNDLLLDPLLSLAFDGVAIGLVVADAAAVVVAVAIFSSQSNRPEILTTYDIPLLKMRNHVNSRSIDYVRSSG